MINWRTNWWWIFLVIVVLLAVTISLVRPVYFFLIPTAGKWAVLEWINKLYPPALSVVLAVLLLLKDELQKISFLRWWIVGGVVFKTAVVVYTAGALYLLWHGNELGRYFLPPYSNYYLAIIWRVAEPHAVALLSGVGLIFFLFVLRSLKGSRLLGDLELLAAGFIGLMLGFERSVIALVLALVIGIILGMVLRLKKSVKFVRLADPLLVGAILSLFVGADLARILFGT